MFGLVRLGGYVVGTFGAAYTQGGLRRSSVSPVGNTYASTEEKTLVPRVALCDCVAVSSVDCYQHTTSSYDEIAEHRTFVHVDRPRSKHQEWGRDQIHG